MRLEKPQGILPTVLEARRTAPPSPGYPQPTIGRGPTNDGMSGGQLPVTTAEVAPGTALPAVIGGLNCSPSRRIPQAPGQHPLGVLAARHALSQQAASASDGGSTSGTGRFYHTTAASSAITGNPVLAPGDTLPGTGAVFSEAAGSNTANTSAGPAGASAPLLRAVVSTESLTTPSAASWDDRPPPPSSPLPPPPAVIPLGVTPPAIAGGSRGCRRSFPSMRMVGQNSRPTAARRSLSPNLTEQPRITRMGTSIGVRTLPHSTSTVSPYYRAGAPSAEAPGSPGGQMQPRPPLQTAPPQVPAVSLLPEDHGASSPSLHSGALLSPRLMRVQLAATSPPHPPDTALKMASSRQGAEVQELLERSSAPEPLTANASSDGAAIATTAADTPNLLTTTIEDPLQPVGNGGIGGDAKQSSMLAELAAAVSELQRRVTEMASRHPYDIATMSDAGSGYSWCTSTRSSAPGSVVFGDSSSLHSGLGLGYWGTFMRGAVSSSGVSVRSASDRTTDERIAVLERQMKQIAAAVCDVATSASAASAPTKVPVGAAIAYTLPSVSNGSSNGNYIGVGGGGPEGSPQSPKWSEPSEASGPSGHNIVPAPRMMVSLAPEIAMGLALGFVAASALRNPAGSDGPTGASPPSSASCQRSGRLVLPTERGPAALAQALSAPQLEEPNQTVLDDGHQVYTAFFPETAALKGQLHAVEQQIPNLECRLWELERTINGQTGSAVAASASAAADEEEQRQRQLQAAVQVALAAAMRGTATDWQIQQLEARLHVYEKQLQQLQQQQQSLDEPEQVTVPDGADNGVAVAIVSAAADGGTASEVSTESMAITEATETPSGGEAEEPVKLSEGESLLELLEVAGGQKHEHPAPSPASQGSGENDRAPRPSMGDAWQLQLQELILRVQDMALDVSSARAQSSSCATEIQEILEEVRAVQATAAAAAANARQASTTAAAAERIAAAALHVVDVLRAAGKAIGNGQRRRSMSTGGAAPTAAANSAGGAGGLQCPSRSEVWLSDARFMVAPAPTAIVISASQQEPADDGDDETDDEDEEEEDELHLVDTPTSTALPFRRLAARDVGFRIQSDGADVTISDVGGSATLYGVSASRGRLLEAALARLSEVEAEYADLRSKVGKALALRVTRDELRESIMQMDMKIRSALEQAATDISSGSTFNRVTSPLASIGFRPSIPAGEHLSSDGVDGSRIGGSVGDGAVDSGCDEDCTVMATSSSGGRPTAGPPTRPAAPGQWVTAGSHLGRQGTATGSVRDSVSCRIGGSTGSSNELSAALTQLDRSVGIVEQRLAAVEASVTQCGTAQVALSVSLHQVQQQQLQAQLQLQLLQPLQDQAATAPPQPYSLNDRVARLYDGNGSGSSSMPGLDNHSTQVLTPCIELHNEARATLGRQVRALLGHATVTTTGASSGQQA